jgi:hypothetical protein
MANAVWTPLTGHGKCSGEANSKFTPITFLLFMLPAGRSQPLSKSRPSWLIAAHITSLARAAEGVIVGNCSRADNPELVGQSPRKLNRALLIQM